MNENVEIIGPVFCLVPILALLVLLAIPFLARLLDVPLNWLGRYYRWVEDWLDSRRKN